MGFLRLIEVLLILISIPACTGKDGSTGPTGATGSPGTPAPLTFEAFLQNGVYPNTSYNGEIDTWLNGAAPTTNENASPYLEINTGSTIANYGRILTQFNVSSIPANASVVSAELLLTTETTTNVGSSPVTIGLHNFSASTLAACTWILQATWTTTGSRGWNQCDGGDISQGQEGYINPTTMSTVVFTFANNGKSQIFKWSIDPTVVQAWVAGTYNNGLILKSEGEFGEPTSTVDFFPYNGTTGSTAQLVVEYQ